MSRLLGDPVRHSAAGQGPGLIPATPMKAESLVCVFVFSWSLSPLAIGFHQCPTGDKIVVLHLVV